MSDTPEAIEAEIEALREKSKTGRGVPCFSSRMNELEVKKLSAQKKELERSIRARAKRAQPERG